MNSLSEKYRPQLLRDLRGQNQIVKMLASFVKNPTPKAFLFAGPQGCGKTSAAIALAREIGIDVDKKELGGFYEIPSGDFTAETIRELFRTTLQFYTMFGNGWKLVLCNEADFMSKQAEALLLDRLENLSPKTIFVFTTNDTSKLTSRFRSRCECHVFKTAIKAFGELDSIAENAAQSLIDDVWQKELGHNHSPKLSDLDGWKEDGNLSFRSVINALEPLIRLQREIDLEQASKPVEIERAPLPSGRVSALAEMEMAAKMLNFATA
jgi:DNA polymerase III delta prime subunit